MQARWMGYILIILGLLLAGASPAAASPDAPREAVCRALAWLATQQGPDGSFGFHMAGGTYQPSASATADAVYVLALLGEDPGGEAWSREGHSPVEALASLAPTYVGTDAGQTGKVARAVALAGSDPRAFAGMDLVALIEAAYDPATGRYHPALLFRHTLAVEGLLRAGVNVPQDALDTLLDAQLADGGWFWSFDGAQSDVDTTGRVMQLLAGQARVPASQTYARATEFLAQVQTAAGGWGVDASTPPNSNSTALALNGLMAAGMVPEASELHKEGRSALDTLLSFQEESGAFVYIRQPGKEEVRLMATLDALTALAPMVSGRPLCGTQLSDRAVDPQGPVDAGWRAPLATGIYLPLILVL